MEKRRPQPDLAAFWAVASTCSGLGASVLVASGSFSVTPESIAASAGTYWEQNPHVVQALAQQAAEGQAGVWLLVVGVAFGLPALWAEQKPTGAARSRPLGWLLGFVLGCALTGAAFAWASYKTAALIGAIGAK